MGSSWSWGWGWRLWPRNWKIYICSIFLVSCSMSWLPRRRYEAHSLRSDHILERILRCPTSFYLPQHERFSVSSFWCLGGAGKESISSSSGCWDFVWGRDCWTRATELCLPYPRRCIMAALPTRPQYLVLVYCSYTDHTVRYWTLLFDVLCSEDFDPTGRL